MTETRIYTYKYAYLHVHVYLYGCIHVHTCWHACICLISWSKILFMSLNLEKNPLTTGSQRKGLLTGVNYYSLRMYAYLYSYIAIYINIPADSEVSDWCA